MYVKWGVEEADLDEGSWIVYGERVLIVGLWELISVMVVGGDPRSMSFDPENRLNPGKVLPTGKGCLEIRQVALGGSSPVY